MAPSVAANAAEQPPVVPLPAVVVDEEFEEGEEEEMVDPGRADAGVVLVEMLLGEVDKRAAVNGVAKTVPMAESLGSSDV